MSDLKPEAYTGPFPVCTGPALDGSFVSAVYMPTNVVRVMVCEGGDQSPRHVDFSVHEALRIRDALNRALAARATGLEILAHAAATGSGVQP